MTITSTVSEFAFFTPAVKPLLQRLASRKDDGWDSPEIGPDEAAFIAARDSFYLASMGEDGWPYTQVLRGSKGCLQPLDNATVAFTGAPGSRQNVSPGNVLLFLMGGSAQRRLKIWAHSEICDNPLILENLSGARYSAGMRHTFLFRVTDFEWDSPEPQLHQKNEMLVALK